MGIFDFLKSKVKSVTNAIENKPTEEARQETREEEVKVEPHVEEEVEEQGYVASSKTIQGVPYPNGWENLSEDQIANKMVQVMNDYNEADGDDDKEDAIIEGHGFEHAGHYEDFKNATIMDKANREGTSYSQAGMDQSMAQQEAALQTEIDSNRDDLQPVDGVSLEDWANANASLASSGSIEEALRITKKDQAGWDKVNEEWQTRMANDTTFTIAQVYGKAFTANATGNLGGSDDISVESFPYEKYVEVRVAQNLLTQQGKDAQEVLAMFDLTVTDWSNLGAFWSKEFHSNIDMYRPLDLEYTEKYTEKYKAGDSNTDIEF